MKDIFDLYTDYLMSSFSQTSATLLSELLDGKISHDKITRFLAESDFTSKELWQKVKKPIRKISESSNEYGVLVFDDTISEKPHSRESDIINWHFDHTKGHSVKGTNIVTCLYVNGIYSLPISYEIICKYQQFDIETHECTRKSLKTKNEYFREMLSVALKNQVDFKYVLADSWYSSSENMKHIAGKIKKKFIMPLKSNRMIAFNFNDFKNKNFVKISKAEFPETPVKAWIRGLGMELLVHKQIFKNKNGTTGILYLATNDLNITKDEIEEIYQKRWNIEVYHKSIKQNTSLSKSPARRPESQANHIFMSIWGYVKLHIIAIDKKTNQFALNGKIYMEALKNAFLKVTELTEELHYNT